VASHPGYQAILERAWTKPELAEEILEALAPYPPENVIKIEVGVDFQFPFPWRRNWAMIVVVAPS
jgi:hypothetical protein